MTRRKQNSPKRLNCFSEDNSSGHQMSAPEPGDDNSEEAEDGAVDSDEGSDDNSQMSDIEIHEDIPKITENITVESDSVTKSPNRKSKNSFDMEINNLDCLEKLSAVQNKDSSDYSSHKNILDDNILYEADKIKLEAQTPNIYKTFEKFSFKKSAVDDQPLDLSTKSKEKCKVSSGFVSNGNFSDPISSSLKSLQLRFGGNFSIEPLHKPPSVVPLQPTKHPGKSTKQLFQSTCQTPLPAQIKANIKPAFMKREGTPPVVTSKNNPPIGFDDESHVLGNKYTTHRCSCLKSYPSLQALSLHIQDTGHAPANAKAATLLDYPKLVRGQDMWLNQESEQTRRILRCMQCGESFQSLPMLTVHMMKTQHYTKIVSADHGRRSHKCSAYCEKELERECVFKCKVCQEAFADMEGLANHMVQSGHHKKQVLRAQNYSEFTLRNRRKRFHSDEGSSALTAYYDLKRKCLPVPNGLLDDEDSFTSVHQDNSITCENCGKKIEMKYFVDHVRACIHKKSSVIGALKNKLLIDSYTYEESDCDNSCSPPAQIIPESVKRQSPSPKIETKAHVSQHLKSRILEAFSPRNRKLTSELNSPSSKDKKIDDKMERLYKTKEEMETETKIASNHKFGFDEAKLSELVPLIKERELKSLLKTRIKIKTEPIEESDSREINDGSISDEGTSKISKELSMDILDPDANMPTANSALQAMESFIQKSFTSKFDFRRQNCIPVSSNLQKNSLHTGTIKRETTSHRESSPTKYSKYKHLYEVLHHKKLKNGHHKKHENVHSGSKRSVENFKKTENNSRKYSSGCEKKDDKTIKLDQDNRSDTPESNQGYRDGHTPMSSPTTLHNYIVNKYLNVEDESFKNKKDNSALDSLSSFVYSQPMTSEHPLDSLQRLLTKTDIPKSLSRHFDLPYLTGIPELALPLNLSLKPGYSDEEEDQTQIDVENDELSSNEERASPESEGEKRDYKCAACSRQFVSKGSYRYHLSRCHLSSVHKYGIKEAFNMSPYIYLPLDHTAKFSKYYEMAYELANKGK